MTHLVCSCLGCFLECLVDLLHFVAWGALDEQVEISRGERNGTCDQYEHDRVSRGRPLVGPCGRACGTPCNNYTMQEREHLLQQQQTHVRRLVSLFLNPPTPPMNRDIFDDKLLPLVHYYFIRDGT